MAEEERKAKMNSKYKRTNKQGKNKEVKEEDKTSKNVGKKTNKQRRRVETKRKNIKKTKEGELVWQYRRRKVSKTT